MARKRPLANRSERSDAILSSASLRMSDRRTVAGVNTSSTIGVNCSVSSSATSAGSIP